MQPGDLIFGIVTVTTVILILFAGLFILLYFNNKNKQLFAEKQKNAEIQFMNELVKSKMEIKNETLALVAAELHDNIGQMLTLLKLQSGSLNQENLEDKKKDILLNLNDTITEVKQLQKNLNLGLDGNLSIWDNLLTQIARIKHIQNLKVDDFFDLDFIKKFSGDKQLLLVRIIQEFLNNSLKYSQCNQISIRVFSEDSNNLHIKLSDNGQGFDFKKIDSGEGLKNMKNRAELLGASFKIKSKLGVGTELILNCKP